MYLIVVGGHIVEVQFASYGSPEGGVSVGYKAHPQCHHMASTSVVEKACLGQRSCNLTASPQFWSQQGAMPDCSHTQITGERTRLAVVRKVEAPPQC